MKHYLTAEVSFSICCCSSRLLCISCDIRRSDSANARFISACSLAATTEPRSELAPDDALYNITSVAATAWQPNQTVDAYSKASKNIT